MIWARWERAEGCTGGPESGAVALSHWLGLVLPQGHSGGIYNCRTVRGSSVPSMHGEGRAVDWMMPVVDGRGHPAGREAITKMGEHGRRLGIQCVIFDRTIWSARSPNGRRYNGAHPHHDHLHVELTRQAAKVTTLSGLRSVLGAKAFDVAEPRPMLRRGSRGDAVRELQAILGRVQVDGIFGPKTDKAVRRFQRRAGLKVDGIVGPATWGRLVV